MSKNRILKALALSNENLEDSALAGLDEAEVGDQAEVEEAAVEEPDMIAEEVADAAEAEQEVEADEAVVDKLDEAAATLESLYMALYDDKEVGLSPQAARYMNIAVESAMSAVGLEDSFVASVESFQGHSNRVQATELSLESIGAKIKQMWAAIIAWLKKVKDNIVAFLSKYLSLAGRVEARAKSLKEKAKSDAAVTVSVPAKTLSALISADNNILNNPNDAAKLMKDVITEAGKFDKEAADFNKEIFDNIKSMASKLSSSSGEFGADDLKWGAGVRLSLPNGTHWSKAKDNAVVSSVLPGNKVYRIAKKTIKLGDSVEINWFSSGLQAAPTVATITENQDKAVKPLSCINVALELVDLFKSTQADADKRLKATKDALKEIQISDDASTAQSVKIRGLMRSYRQADAEISRGLVAIASHGVRVANAFLDAAQLAISKGGEGKADGGKKAADGKAAKKK